MEEHYITLDNVDGDEINIKLNDTPIIKDEKYWKTYFGDSIYIGNLIDNFYIKYEFIKRTAGLGLLYNKYILPNPEDILCFDSLYPVVPKEITIKNVGPKIIIIDNEINNINTSTGSINTFNNLKCIAHGTYKKSDREDLFKYMNEDGELFALLVDPQTKKPTLVNMFQIIKLIDAKDFKVNVKDGLYNGYELKDNIDGLSLRHDFAYIYNDIFLNGSFLCNN